jgi:hypothetical protein
MVTVEAELFKREAEFVRVLQAGAEPTRAADAGTAVSMARVRVTRPHVIAALRALGADVAVYQKVPASV